MVAMQDPWGHLGPLYTRSPGQCSTQIEHSYWCKNLNQPQGAYNRSQGWNRKSILNLPQLTNINVELYGLLLALRLKKRIPPDLGSQFATLGANVRAFINIMRSLFYHLLVTLGQTTSQRCSKLAPKPFQPWLQLYRGLNSMLNMMPICTCKCHAKGRAWCTSVASMNVTGTWDGSNPFHQALNAHAMVVSSVGRSLEKMVSYEQESKGRLFINNPL